MEKKTIITRTPQHRILTEWLILGLALFMLGGYIATSLYLDFVRIDTQERERLSNQALIVEKNLAPQLFSTNRALDGLLSDFPFWQMHKSGIDQANWRLKVLSDTLVGVRTLLIIDAKGKAIASNREELIGQDLAFRDYFQTALKNPTSNALFVSPPFKTLLNNFLISLVRVIHGPQGEFAGIITASLDPEYFKILLESVLYAPDMWSAITHGDGKLFLMMPEREQTAGMDLAKPGSFYTRHLESGQASTQLTGIHFATGEESLTAMRTIQPANVPMDKPLIVTVRRSPTAIFASWRREAVAQAILFVTLALTTILSLFYYQQRQRAYFLLADSHALEQEQNTERLQLATKAAGVGVWEYDLVSGRLTWGETMFTIYGLDPTSFTHQYEVWRACVLPDDLPEVESEIQYAIHHGQPFDSVFRIQRGDGEIRIIQALGRVQLDTSDKPIRLLGINQDITNQRENEQALWESEHFLAKLIDIIPGMVGYWTAELRCGFANREYLTWFGKTTEEMNGIALRELLCDELFALNQPYIEGALKGVPQHFERSITKPNGETGYTWAHYLPDFENGEVRGFFVLVSDITAMKQTQLELEKLNEDLKQRNREVEAASHCKGQFLANMSHEIRTPMNTIIGMGDLLQESILTPTQRSYVEVLNRAGAGLMALINDILDLSKIEAGQLSLEIAPFDLGALVRETVDFLLVQAKAKGILLTLDLPSTPGALLVQGDAQRLRQILLNLLGNAIKFTLKGEVLLRITLEGADELLFMVRDTGIGIASEQQKTIFQPFTQADATTTRRFGGTGLGLAICHQLVEQMGGRIWVVSQQGVGSAFYCTARLPKAEQLTVQPHVQENTSPRGQEVYPLSVLLVDDADDNRMLIEAFLKKTPYRLAMAQNGQEAVERFRVDRFDLVLMDMQMPIMDGYTATRFIRQWEQEQHRAPTPIIALTANAMREDAQKTIEAGCDLHLTKPIYKRRLLEVLDQYARRDRDLPANQSMDKADTG